MKQISDNLYADFVAYSNEVLVNLQATCAEKNIWCGRLVSIFFSPARILINLSLPIGFAVERTIRCALNLFGVLAKEVTRGAIGGECSLKNAGKHFILALGMGRYRDWAK